MIKGKRYKIYRYPSPVVDGEYFYEIYPCNLKGEIHQVVEAGEESSLKLSVIVEVTHGPGGNKQIPFGDHVQAIIFADTYFEKYMIKRLDKHVSEWRKDFGQI